MNWRSAPVIACLVMVLAACSFTTAAVARPLASNGEASSDGAGSALKSSPAQKLVLFTEHRDTLNYLEQRITTMLGRKEAVVCIHGGMGREERMNAQEPFRHDPEVKVSWV
jgi:hypothetical protein